MCVCAIMFGETIASIAIRFAFDDNCVFTARVFVECQVGVCIGILWQMRFVVSPLVAGI